MLAASHELPMEPCPANPPQAHLAQAFSEFLSASASLELSYRELQAKVAELTFTLSERDRELSNTLSEKNSMARLLQKMVEAMPCGVLVVSGAGAIRLANPEAARLLALSAAQMPDLAAIRLHTGLDQLFLQEPLRPDEPAGAAEQEISFRSSAGQHWIAVRRVPLPAVMEVASTTGPGAVFTLQDISARKRSEQQREAARDTVALAQVSALLAHEIRNPLASLELFASLLAEDPNRSAEWLSHLRAGIRSLSGTVNNVLTLNGETPPFLERVDLSLEADLASRFLQPLAQQANVSLSLETMEPSLGIQANRSALHQLLLNLCSNALRHTPAGGEVRIRCARGSADKVLVSVSDNGSGIAKEHLSRLFEGGFSGSGTRPGLGLAVCRRLMDIHGGAIHVTSQMGAGSTFTLEFQPG